MICPILRQFKSVVTMAILIRNRIVAILADAFIALVNVLLEFEPAIKTRPPVPREAHIWNVIYRKESSHTSPDNTLPNRAIHCAHRTPPRMTLTTKSEPYLAQPHPTPLDQTLPRKT
jgi:hypothetical protein